MSLPVALLQYGWMLFLNNPLSVVATTIHIHSNGNNLECQFGKLCDLVEVTTSSTYVSLLTKGPSNCLIMLY